MASDVAFTPPFFRPATAGTAVALIAIYAIVLAWLPNDVFWHPDEGAKFFIMRTIGADAQPRAVPYRGVRLDPNYGFYPDVPYSTMNLYPEHQPDGSIVMQMPPWFPWLTRAPVYLFGVSGVFVIPLLSGFLIAMTAGWITQRFTPSLAAVAILSVGLATPVCFYSFCFWEHTLAAWLALLAVALLIRRPNVGWMTAVAVALLTYATLLFRLEMLAFVIAVPIAWAIAATRAPAVAEPARPSPIGAGSGRMIRLGLLAVGIAALCSLPLLLPYLPARHYERVVMLPRAFVGMLAKMEQLPQSLVAVWINFGRGEAPALPLPMAWLGLVGICLCVAAPFVRTVRIEAVMIIAGLTLVLAVSLRLLLWPLPYRAIHGVFPIAPALAVFAYALVDGWHRRASALITVATLTAVYLAATTLAVFAIYFTPSGEFWPALEWGPRFFLPLYPLMTVLTLAGMAAYWSSPRPQWLKATLVGMVALGCFIGLQFEARGLLMLKQTRSRLALWQQALPNAEPVVTDIWWFPSALAPYFVDHEVFHAPNDRRLQRWIKIARNGGVSSFTFAGFRRPFPKGVESINETSVAGLQIVHFRIRPQ